MPPTIDLICYDPLCGKPYSIPLSVHRRRQERSPRNYCSSQCAARDKPRHHPRGTLKERFWRKVTMAGPDECWLWHGSKSKEGYGRFQVFVDGKLACSQAHVASWFLAHDTFPQDNLQVLHNCPGGDNRACINPAHLWLGTQKDNMIDCVRKGRNGNVTHPERLARGEQHGMHKLTDTQWQEILVLLQEDAMSRRQIAAHYGIYHNSIISRLRSRGLTFPTKIGRRRIRPLQQSS